MAKHKRHNPEKRAFKGRSHKKGAARISALRLRDFVRDIQETMALCEHEGSTEYLLEGIEDAFKKHKIPQLELVEDDPGEDGPGVTFKGDRIVPTVENPDTYEFEDIDE